MSRRPDDDEQISFSDDAFSGGDGSEIRKAEDSSAADRQAAPHETKKRRRMRKALEEVQEKIIDVEYSDIMRKSYIDYSMSVITSRALPDVRDGLKPVQRRILYDMSQLGVDSTKPYRKVARIVGDTMGKYHPHGDSSIGEAIVVMAQDWKKMAPMVDGHGNFGSIEGDEAAAARYIECRLTRYSEDVLLSDLDENTVDFVPNYDEQEKEPVILPAKLPNLLINGSEGIAVGMATNIPTHNVGETIDAAVYYLDHPDATTKELMQFIPGPDFPTGGIVSNQDELLNVYETGAGRIKVRGKVTLEEDRNGRQRLVITEIPYTMIGDGIGKFLQSVAELAENKTLPEITDISNQSSKEGIRIVLELKKGADPERVKAVLFKKTKLEDTYGYNLLAISNGRPETMSLADVYSDYADFQYEIYSRKYQNLLAKAAKKKEIDEGLMEAINAIDAVVEVIRGSKTVKQAKECLMTGQIEGIVFKTEESRKIASSFHFTSLQAEAVLELRLQRLVGLELNIITEDYRKITKSMARYEKLLDSNTEMTKEIKKGLTELKEKYGVPRRTRITQAKEIVLEEKPEEVQDTVVLSDRFHYVHCVDPSVYEKASENGALFRYELPARTDQKVIVFTDTGRAYTVKVRDIPSGKLKDKGIPIDNISSYDSRNENIVSLHVLNPQEEWIFITSDGLVKRVHSEEYDISRKATDAIRLSEGARVVDVLTYTGGPIELVTDRGYHLCFSQEEISTQGKMARGIAGIKLTSGDFVTEVSLSAAGNMTHRGLRGRKLSK